MLPCCVKNLVLSLLFALLSQSAGAQDLQWGFSAGISLDAGTKVNRLGLHATAFGVVNFVQLNAGVKAYYNFQSLGLKKKTPELQVSGGLNFGFGQKDSVVSRFMGTGENNTLYRNAFGYSYLHYADRNQTSQSTGIFNVQVRQFLLMTENDLFAGGKGWRDRFRTGAFLIGYTYKDLRFAVSSVFWTGDYVGCEIVRDSLYPARFGYRKEAGSHYGKYALGLLSAQVNWAIPTIPLHQNLRVNVGIDAEQVRNGIQNRFIHDQPYLPKSWIKHENPHIPMISDQQDQYLFQPGQRVRPASFYFNLGLNSPVFY